MPSSTDVCNDALGQIGHNFITNINDSDRPAAVCKRFYDTSRDQVFRQNNWNFARKRANLARNLIAPLFEWTFSYQLPSDCIRPLRVGTTDAVPWKVEGRNILTDEEGVSLLYTSRVLDPVQWDPLFYDALSILLASKLAKALIHDIKFSLSLFEQYSIAILEAAAVDGQEGTPDTIRVPDLIDIRTVP